MYKPPPSRCGLSTYFSGDLVAMVMAASPSGTWNSISKTHDEQTDFVPKKCQRK